MLFLSALKEYVYVFPSLLLFLFILSLSSLLALFQSYSARCIVCVSIVLVCFFSCPLYIYCFYPASPLNQHVMTGLLNADCKNWHLYPFLTYFYRKMKDPMNNVGFFLKTAFGRAAINDKNPKLKIKLHNEVHPMLSVST